VVFFCGASPAELLGGGRLVLHTDNLSERKVADSMAHRRFVWLSALIAALILVSTAGPLTLAKNPSPPLKE